MKRAKFFTVAAALVACAPVPPPVHDASNEASASALPEDCQRCERDTDCRPDWACRRRACDGIAGCVPLALGAATCPSIERARCPGVATYGDCSRNPVCASGAHCTPFGVDAPLCLRACEIDGDCITRDGPDAGLQQCIPAEADGPRRCMLICGTSGAVSLMCPTGMRCRIVTRDARGEAGYCRPN